MNPHFLRLGIGVCLLATLVAGIVGLQIVASRHTGPGFGDSFPYLRTAQAALVLSLLWSAVCVRSEPVLVRVTLVIVAVAFFTTFWVYRL